MHSPEKINSNSKHLILWSIVNMLMFLPLGIVCAVYSVKANRASDQGTQLHYASVAKKWNTVATIYGILQIIIVIYENL